MKKGLFYGFIVAGFLLTIMLVYFVSMNNRAQHFMKAQSKIENMSEVVRRHLSDYKDVLLSMDMFYRLDLQTSNDEFAVFFHSLLTSPQIWRGEFQDDLVEYGWISAARPQDNHLINARDGQTETIETTFDKSRISQISQRLESGQNAMVTTVGETSYIVISIETQKKVNADYPDNSSYSDGGFIYLILDVSQVLASTSHIHPDEFRRFKISAAQPQTDAFTQPITLEIFQDILTLYVSDEVAWSILGRENASAQFLLLIGGCLSFLVGIYIKRILMRNKQYHEALDKADTANRLKSEFLATMSHEIRSPMSGILGMAELLQQTPQSHEQKGYTQTIINSAEALLRIIEDILDFSKIEANKLEIEEVAVDMLELVDEICALYSPRAREKALELVVRYKPGTEQFVYADPVRMRQILGNLVNNAIKFTHKGHVVVTVTQESASQENAQMVNLRFDIKDTGIGIAEEAKQRIFEKFMQADTATTRNFGGTGLGLSICKRLSEMMGGRISLETKLGEGSVFTVNLPLKRNRDVVFQAPKPPVLRDVKILIVDDLNVVRQLVNEQLSLVGMRCSVADRGDDALRFLKMAAQQKDPFDMVIIDYLMPGMNGEMLARAISDEPELRNTCLIMLTAAGTPALSLNLAEKGFSACLSKPIKSNDLISILAYVWEEYKNGNRAALIEYDRNRNNNIEEQQDLRLEGRRLLLAEDSRINQAFAREVLESMGCKVDIASNGQEALEALAVQTYDLILMDCQMPVMDGFEAARRISEWKQGGYIKADLPIVALTANAMEGDRQRCIDAGMNDYLSKPVRRQDLKEAVFTWLGTPPVPDAVSSRLPVKSNIIPLNASAKSAAKPAGNMLVNHEAVKEARLTFKGRYAEMLALYGEDTQQYLAQIHQALLEQKVEAVILPAHTIKSSSLRMGADAVSHAAKSMEIAAQEMVSGKRPPDVAALQQELADMEELYKRSLPLLENEAGRDGATRGVLPD